ARVAGPAFLKIAEMAERGGAVPDVIEAYRQMLQVTLSPPLQEYVVYRLAENLEREGRLAEARDRYRTLRDRGKDEAIATRAAYRLGLVALAERDAGGALRESEALGRSSAGAELREGALLLAGEAAARGDDANRAAALFRLALKEFPASPRASRTRLALGWALRDDGDPESALREWRALIPGSDH